MRFISELARYSNSEVSGFCLQCTPGNTMSDVVLVFSAPKFTLNFTPFIYFEKHSLSTVYLTSSHYNG